MKSSTTTTVFGIGMILGSVPCTIASFLVWQLTAALREGRAAGRDVGFDAIGVVMAMYVAFLIALATCVAGLFCFGYAVRTGKVALKGWHRFGIVYSLCQVTIAFLYMTTR